MGGLDDNYEKEQFEQEHSAKCPDSISVDK